MSSVELIFLELAILILSLSFHEAAHAWTANKLGDPTARLLGRLTLNPLKHIDWIGTVLFPLIAAFSNLPLIGWAKPVPVDTRYLKQPRRDFAIVAAAGPASNILLAIVGALLYRAVSGAALESAGGLAMAPPILNYFVGMNCMLAVFNMIPVPPLDGGNVLMGLVPERAASAINWLRPYGFLILYALMFSGILSQVMWPISYTLQTWLL